MIVLGSRSPSIVSFRSLSAPVLYIFLIKKCIDWMILFKKLNKWLLMHLLWLYDMWMWMRYCILSFLKLTPVISMFFRCIWWCDDWILWYDELWFGVLRLGEWWRTLDFTTLNYVLRHLNLREIYILSYYFRSMYQSYRY